MYTRWYSSFNDWTDWNIMQNTTQHIINVDFVQIA